MLLNKIERIGKEVAAQVENDNPEVRISFSVTQSANSDMELSIWLSSVLDDRERAFQFSPPDPFYNYDETRMAAELRAKMMDYIRQFKRKRR